MPGSTVQTPCIGTSGWAYPGWKPDFYPQGTPARKLLACYASQLTSVEVNYTFRTLPTPAMIANWLTQTEPFPEFRFSFKAPQRITHFARLLECAEPLAALLESLAPVARAGRMGLILFQLPPSFKADLPRLQSFLALPVLRRKACPPLAFEFRHPTWFVPETYALLTRRNAALCIAEGDDLVTPEVHTAATHTCFRLRRSGGYTPRELAAFARRLRAVSKDRAVYVYLRHEDAPTGALNARDLLKRMRRKASPEPKA